MEEMVRAAQSAICGALGPLDERPFQEDAWRHPEGGGGVSRVLQDGTVFDKAGVNVAAVEGRLHPEALAAMIAKQDLEPAPHRFVAVGLSVVVHPRSPWVPTVHCNYRYFELDDGRWWFGGGTDLTPAYLVADDGDRTGEDVALCVGVVLELVDEVLLEGATEPEHPLEVGRGQLDVEVVGHQPALPAEHLGVVVALALERGGDLDGLHRTAEGPGEDTGDDGLEPLLEALQGVHAGPPLLALGTHCLWRGSWRAGFTHRPAGGVERTGRMWSRDAAAPPVVVRAATSWMLVARTTDCHDVSGVCQCPGRLGGRVGRGVA